MEMIFGVRAHDLASHKEPQEVMRCVKEHGFSWIQLVFKKAFLSPSYEPDFLSNVKASLDEEKIKIAMLGAYFNPVHSDKNVVAEGIHNFEENLRIAPMLQAPYVGSETGSYNDSPWTYVPRNHTEEGYQSVLKVFKHLAQKANSYHTDILIEPAWNHVIYSPQVLKRLLSDLTSPHVHVTIDLYNLLYEGNFALRDEIFEESLRMFGLEVKIIHLKDAKIVNGKMTQFSPGEGDFHYSKMLVLIKKYCPDAMLIFEGVKSDKIDFSFRFLKQLV